MSCIGDTNSVNLTVTGGVLTADLIVDPDVDNLAEVTAAGLLVSGANTAVPVGAVLPYGGTVAPTGYLAANGAAVSRSQYATLFGVVGTKYGPGDGVTTFNLPKWPAAYRQRDQVLKQANTPIVGPNEGNPTVVITGNPVYCDGTSTFLLEFWCPATNGAGTVDDVMLFRDGGVSLGITPQQVQYGARTNHLYVTPTAGAHTFSACAYSAAGLVIYYAGPGGPAAFVPAYLRVSSSEGISIIKT